MRILVFTEGTIIMHKNAAGLSREKIVNQVENNEESVHCYTSYIPVGDVVQKIANWKKQGAEIAYLTSRRKPNEISDIENVLERFGFPDGQLIFRKDNEEYKDVVERIAPDVLIEDDCESIGGITAMTITYVKPEIRERIKSIAIKEFGGIDPLPGNISDLAEYQ